MCGRYYRRSDKQRIAEAFHLGRLPDDFVLPPDFNVAPSTFQPVVRAEKETGGRELVLMRWGLVRKERGGVQGLQHHQRQGGDGGDECDVAQAV